MGGEELRSVTLKAAGIQVELLPELGARMHRLVVFGHDLLRTPANTQVHVAEPFAWGSYPMAPWCNRIDPAPTRAGELVVAVPTNFPDGTALHGLVYLVPWHEVGEGVYTVRGGGGESGWPWPFEARQTLQVADSGTDRASLSVEQVLTNLGQEPMPGGLGLHPWFRRPVDVRITAEHVLRSNVDATCRIEPVTGAFDLRSSRPMPSGLDATWVDPGRPQVELRWPDLGVRAVMTVASDAGVCIVAASPADAGAVAVEPETHAPQGLRRLLTGEPHGLAWLKPGGSITLTTRIDFDRIE